MTVRDKGAKNGAVRGPSQTTIDVLWWSVASKTRAIPRRLPGIWGFCPPPWTDFWFKSQHKFESKLPIGKLRYCLRDDILPKNLSACPTGYPWETWFARWWRARDLKSLDWLKSRRTHLGWWNWDSPSTGMVGGPVLYRFTIGRSRSWKGTDWRTWNIDISSIMAFFGGNVVTIIWIIFRACGSEERYN